MLREPQVFDEEYFGYRWRYGLDHRPPGIGCVPRGRVIGADRPHRDWPFGYVDYACELSAEDVAAYELHPLGRFGPG